MKNRILLAILLLFGVSAFAQKKSDYIITNKGDTLSCKIKRPFLSSLRYTLPGDTAKYLNIDSIKGYYIAKDDNLVRAVFIGNKKKPKFIDVIENGLISLYQVVNTHYSMYGGSSSTTTWYIGKGSDRVTELKTNALFAGKSRDERKNDFAEMIKDKPNVYEKYMAENKFNFNFIQNLVHLYNTGKLLSEEKTEAKKDDAY